MAFAIRYSYGLLLPDMLTSLAITKTEAGVIFSAYFFTYTIFSPLLGLLVDRTDARVILTVFVSILGLSACLMSFAGTVLQASIFFALGGIGHSACWVPVVTVVLRWVGEKRRGIALAFVDLGSAISIAFWSLVIPLLTVSHTWRTVWVILGICGFVAAGMNFFLVKSHPPVQAEPGGTRPAPAPPPPIRSVYRFILRDKKFHLIGFSYALISFAILIPFAFLTAYATQELKVDYALAAGLLAVIGISGSIGKMILSHVSDVVERVKVMILCGVLTGLGGVGLATAHGMVWLIASTVVFGVGYGTIWPVYAASARDFFSKEHAGSIVGLWTLFHGLGSILAPVFAGWTIDQTGTYFWSFILVVISSTLSLLLLLPLRGARRQAAAKGA